jgi:hypothetical protein
MMKSSHHSFVIGETFGSYDNWIRSANRDGFAGDFDLRWVLLPFSRFPVAIHYLQKWKALNRPLTQERGENSFKKCMMRGNSYSSTRT